MGLTGDLSKVRQIRARLEAMPRTVAADVASRAAPAMTTLARAAYDGGRTVYDQPRPAGVDGRTLTLKKTGATERDVRFVAIGTIVRCVLGPRWAKYLIGKYDILPNGRLPSKWGQKIGEIVSTVKPP